MLNNQPEIQKPPRPKTPRLKTPRLKTLRVASLLVALSLLAGCGFHLRGNVDLPPELARVYVSGADRDLVERLSDALVQRGAVVDSVPGAGAAHINLSEARFERQVLTTDVTGRATAYTFRYRVVFGITSGGGGGDGGGAVLQPARSITLERAFDYDPNRELQAEQEVRFLETEMRREAVLRILRRLSRLR